MSLSAVTPSLTAAVETIMREVNQATILPHYQLLTADQIINKAADDLVTVADKESEAMLTERLSRLLPDAVVVGEEATFANASLLENLREKLCWIVDPIDGTNNFASGKPPFGVLVALSDGGDAIGGWILDCLTGRFCHASKSGGAFLNGEAIRATESAQTPPVAAISMVYLDATQRERIKTHIAPHYRLTDIPRCAAEQYPRLVLGTNDVSVFERTLPWDHAAGALFVTEAGGAVRRLDGSAYVVGDGRTGLMAAASPAIWDEAAAILFR